MHLKTREFLEPHVHRRQTPGMRFRVVSHPTPDSAVVTVKARPSMEAGEPCKNDGRLRRPAANATGRHRREQVGHAI